MRRKPAKAPWRIGFRDGSGEECIVDARGDVVAHVRRGCSCCQSDEPLTPQEKMVLRLISQAPKMLRLLRTLVPMQGCITCQEVRDECDLHGNPTKTTDDAQALVDYVRKGT